MKNMNYKLSLLICIFFAGISFSSCNNATKEEGDYLEEEEHLEQKEHVDYDSIDEPGDAEL